MTPFVSVLARLQSYGSHLCIEGNGPAYSYAELLRELERWQSRFDEMNIATGCVVGVCADYSLSAVACLLALFERCAIAALIPRDRDAAQYLVEARATALLELNIQGSYRWHSVQNPTSHQLLDQLRAAGDGGVIMFTSGSTARPKATLQSVERFLHKFRAPGRRMRTLAFLLFDHVAGLDTLFYTLTSGGTLILTRRRDPESILDLIGSYRVEVLPTSPSFLRLLCLAKHEREHDLSSLKIVTYGSEPMDPSTLARLNARLPNTQICQKYGTTETGSPRSVSRGNDSLWLKINSDSAETKIRDDVLWLRSEGTMLGYLNAPSPIDEEGWYCTGDLVDVDGEWIKFRGRVDDTINVGGEKVAPTEVEHSILELGFVRDAVVSGELHALTGQIVTAQVTLTTAALDPKEAANAIRLHCRERLASYKVPVKVNIVAEGLTSDRQKVQRQRASDSRESVTPSFLTEGQECLSK